MAFSGWPEEAIEFYEGLEADNSKAYWTQHKHVYEECVLAPMQALLDDLKKEFGEGKVFRPYRDVRFSNDKTPYKTNIAGTLSRGGYISLSSEGLGCGLGYWMMAGDQLERYREAVDNNSTGKQLGSIAASLRKQKINVSGHGELKSAPRGYPKDHPRIDLLRIKGITAWKSFPVAAWLGTAKAKDNVAKFFRDAKPLNTWLDKHVGPTTQTEARRR